MTKQKSEWYSQFENEIIMFECHDCGCIEDTDEEYEECPDCGGDDFHMETSTSGMTCDICNSYLPDEDGKICYTGRSKFNDAHQYICVDCYNELVEGEEQEEIDKEEEELKKLKGDA